MRSAVALLAIAGLSLVALAGFALGGGSGAHAQSTTIVEVGDVWFCDPGGPQPCTQPFNTTVDVGDTVTWEWGSGGSGTGFSHTTTHCPNDDWPTCSGTREWDSGVKASGTFSHTFGAEDAGKTFFYRCLIHSTMSGNITVLAQPAPTPTPSPTPEPSPQPTSQPSPATATPTPAAAQPAAVPAGGGEPPADGGASALWWWAIAAGGLLLVTAAFALRRLRR